MTDRIKDRLDRMEIPSPQDGFESRIIKAGMKKKGAKEPLYSFGKLVQNRALYSGSLAVALGLFVLVFIGPSSPRPTVDKAVLSEVVVDDGELDDFPVFDEDEFLF